MIILSLIVSIAILCGEKTEHDRKDAVIVCKAIGAIIILLVYRILYLDWISIELALVLFAAGLNLIIKVKYVEKESTK